MWGELEEPDPKTMLDHKEKPDHKVQSLASEPEDPDQTVKPMGYGEGSGSGQPNCGPVFGAPGSGYGEGIGQGSGSGEEIGIGIGGGSSGSVPSVVVPSISIPPITVPGTQIPGFVIPGVRVNPGYGSGGCQTGGCTPSVPYYRPPIYQQPPSCSHCAPFVSGQDKHMSDKGTVAEEALAPTSNEMLV
ncbi:hypothetical protein Bca52824_066473 [Brassica carinata]|uniref:Uncharacterized protein n=1 Tax=Brassica carinata TaxID=52824 RepID=A0A8X7QLK5_BRACI|nr:hypothetical protein Bca52824_066473 [Brassica carinata]